MKSLGEQYLTSLQEGNLSGVLSLFSSDAKVYSPLFGVLTPVEFYQDLFKQTRASKTQLLNVLESSFENTKKALALHFNYEWTLINGTQVQFECVDVFELDEHGKIKQLKIIYDTAPIRSDFERLKQM
jgi:nuclear transport factor 2 (NTF2) superfamily protein